MKYKLKRDGLGFSVLDWQEEVVGWVFEYPDPRLDPDEYPDVRNAKRGWRAYEADGMDEPSTGKTWGTPQRAAIDLMMVNAVHIDSIEVPKFEELRYEYVMHGILKMTPEQLVEYKTELEKKLENWQGGISIIPVKDMVHPEWKRPIFRIRARQFGHHVFVKVLQRGSKVGDTFAVCGTFNTDPIGWDFMRMCFEGNPVVDVTEELEAKDG